MDKRNGNMAEGRFNNCTDKPDSLEPEISKVAELEWLMSSASPSLYEIARVAIHLQPLRCHFQVHQVLSACHQHDPLSVLNRRKRVWFYDHFTKDSETLGEARTRETP
jgi:hypothetical protein